MSATTPEECDALFERHVNAGDLDALVALYEDDAVLVAQPGMPARGRAAIRVALGGLIEAKAQLSMHVVQALHAGDVAVLYNDWHGSMRTPDGQTTAINGKAIEVIRRGPDGSWRFLVDDPFARG